MKETIKKFVLDMGVDDVGFASVQDYHSPRSPKIDAIFPQVRSMVVMVFKELSSCETPNMQIAMNGRLDLMEFSRSCNYKLARLLEKEYNARAMTISASYPLEMSYETKGAVGDVSLRHAAVAAGLGVLGRHNLVIHPEFGTRVIFTAVLSDLNLPSDPKIKDGLCIGCNKCVQQCPAGALVQEGKTDVSRCLKISQPYGIGAAIQFWNRFADGSPEERKAIVKDVNFWRLYQAGFIGFQYFCFKCLMSCPLGRECR